MTLVRERFKNLRERKGFSQLRLFEMSGMTNSHISRFENGKHDLTVNNLEKLLRCMGASFSELFIEPKQQIPVYAADSRANPIEHIGLRGDYSFCYGIKVEENGPFPAGSIAVVSPLTKTEPKPGDIMAFVDDSGVMQFERYRRALHNQYAGVVVTARWLYKR